MTETDPDFGPRLAVPAAGIAPRPTVDGERSAGRWVPRFVHQISPPWRIFAFSIVLVGLAAVLYASVLAGQPHPETPTVPVSWWLIGAAFAVAEVRAVDVHFRREKHSYSLSEVPAVMGMYLLAPGEYFLAMLVGFGAALLWVRTSPLKFAFNLANFAFMGVAMMSTFYVIGGPVGEPDPRSWIGAFAGTSLAAVLSSLTIAAVISISGGASQFEKLPEMIQFGQLVSVANTSLALLAISVLWLDPTLLALLVVPLAAVFLAYRAYGSEKEKHQRLELLYQSSRILQHSPELDSTLGALLEHAREMFRAERAELLLWPRSEDKDGLLTAARHDGPTDAMVPIELADAGVLHARVGRDRRPFLQVGIAGGANDIRQAMAVPLQGESGLIGSMTVVNRLTEGTTFSDDDLRLLETLANQAAVALENGQLEQSLSELSRLKEELRYQAYHDPLTGLANRALFADEVDGALAHAASPLIPVVLFLDLDNFKDVNDTLGHAAGDRLLAAVGDRLRSCLRKGDIAARLGGDEFAILLLDEPDLRDALGVATRLVEALSADFPLLGQELSVSASIGVAACQPGMAGDELLRNADVAMYTAKQSGKNRVSVFDPMMHAAIVARHALTTELARGINDGEIDVYYQPIVSLATGQPYGAEALARWRHPVRGLIGPDDFIPLAEESGTIVALGRAVLFEACREAATWRRGPVPPVVTVNLSAAQLAQDTFVAEVVDILRATGLPATRLVLEMTETAMFLDTQTTISRLGALRSLGVRVAIDDFGTGYSSLGYLRRFPVDILKIAREFVMPADAGPDSWALAHAIVALGQTLGLRVVAEGIEDAAQFEHLQGLGCELGQGFLFARPMPGEDAAAWIAERVASRRRLDVPASLASATGSG